MSVETGLLPGVTFESVPPAVELTLPRMDVAAFVGLASAGPLHVPVVLEDVGRFREVFGADAPLARDPGTASVRHAYLGAAVEEYFRNGGRRCWVVRVADESQASRATFPVTGLVRAAPDGAWRLGTARARAAGSWADGLRVAPELVSTPLPPVATVDAGARTLTLAGPAPVAPGDLLRLTVDAGGAHALVVVGDVSAEGTTTRVRWDGTWVLSALPAGATVRRAALVTVDGETEVAAPTIEPAGGPGRVEAAFAGEAPPGGSLLRLDLDDATTAALVVDRADGAAAGAVGAQAWVLSTTDVAGIVDGSAVADHLSLALTVWAGEHRTHRLADLGLAAGHPRRWDRLPTDEELYGGPGALGGPAALGARAAAEAWVSAAAPRFPLAGPATPSAVWLPLGLPTAPTADVAVGPVSDTDPVLRATRDGLRELHAGLFLDERLADAGAGELVDRAFALTSLGPTSARGSDRLRGMHALTGLDEVTLVAVPDAVHAGWHEVTEVPAPPVPVPHLWPPDARGDRSCLWWTDDPGVTGYVLEEAGTPDLADARVVLDGPAPLGPGPAPGPAPDGATPAVVGLTLAPPPCPALLAWRVRAVDREGRTSGWSRTVTAILPAADFAGHGAAPAPAPDLRLVGRALVWHPPGPVEVESGTDPLLAQPERVRADGGRLPLADHAAGRYHRVRHLAPAPGAWSTTVHQPAPPRPVLVAHSPAAGELVPMTIAVHRALLRLAAGRADVLAVLVLPEHYRDAEATQHLAALTGGAPLAAAPEAVPLPALVRALDGGETGALSHAAVYHPWTGVARPSGARPVPPDGACTGLIASRTTTRGAWVSPGHLPLAGVVALSPALGDRSGLTLLRAGVNVLARRPAGVVALAARTLSTDPALEPIGVRRLMILLRRLALQEGPTYVFEPHDHRFRAMVRRSFEDVLGTLYRRGAFAGAVAADAFRVVADATVNPPGTVEAGRFVVELQVAPAQPLLFLRVRLVQTGPGTVAVSEVAA